MDIYQLLVNDEIINHIVLETNRYAKQVTTSNTPTKNSTLNCPQLTVSRIIHLFKQTGDTESKKSPGHPIKTNPTME